MSAWRSRNWLMAAACLCWAAALRLPFRGNIGEDEAFFAVVAQRWLAGVPPYAGSFDVKPPGLFALFALLEAGFGCSTGAVKALEIVCVGATAVGLYLIGVRHLSRPVGLWAALLYPLYSLTLSGANSAAELLEVPAEVFAALAVLEALFCGRAQLCWVAAAGLLLGTAGMIRQNAVFPAAALLTVVLLRWPAGRPARPLLAFGCGITVMPLAFAMIFLVQGACGALLEDAVLAAAGRMRGDNISFATGVLRFLPSMRPLAPLLCGPILMVTRRPQWRHSRLACGSVVTLAWLAGAAGGILAVRSMYDDYFLALEPPLLLASGIALFHLLAGAVSRRRVIAASLAAAVFPFAVDRTAFEPGIDMPAAAAAAAAIDHAGVPSDATMLVVNRGLPAYLRAHRAPGGRYFHPQHLLCDFPAPDADPLALALAAQPGILLVADETRGMVCERRDRLAELQAAITAGFCHADHVTGARDGIDLYVDRRRYPGVCALAGVALVRTMKRGK